MLIDRHDLQWLRVALKRVGEIRRRVRDLLTEALLVVAPRDHADPLGHGDADIAAITRPLANAVQIIKAAAAVAAVVTLAFAATPTFATTVDGTIGAVLR